MKQVYIVIRNMLLFFFLVAIFSGNIRINDNTVLDKTLVGLAFGVAMMALPNLLKFMKLPVNFGALLLVGLVTSFTFFFVCLYVLEIITIGQGIVNVGISDLEITLQDRTMALVVLSAVSALLSVSLESMSKSK
jgi:hypothetical protein